MIVAVHQPNYLPWLGYFAKLAAADVFVFLDDVQFSKGSFTNRVQIERNGAAAWMTVPVSHAFGATVAEVATAGSDFARVHLEGLRQTYRSASFFAEVWPVLHGWLEHPQPALAALNQRLIREIASTLGIQTRLMTSSAMGVAPGPADVRLASLVHAVAPGGTYLSGRGGGNYQDPAVYARHGIGLRYTAFSSPPYERSGRPFIAGLSIVDALFHLGFAGTADYLRANPA